MLPIIVGGIALAAIFGGKKAYTGHRKNESAEELFTLSETCRVESEESIKRSSESLDELINNYTLFCSEFGKEINSFTILAKEVTGVPVTELNLNIKYDDLVIATNYGEVAKGIATTISGGVLTGALMGFGGWGSMLSLGVASTGTPISALAGASATNAALAAFGGGSLATGGLGIAGGVASLSGITVVPALAAMGWKYDRDATAKLDSALNVAEAALELRENARKLDTFVTELEEYIGLVMTALTRIREVFGEYHEALRNLDILIKERRVNEIVEDEEKRIISNAMNLGQIAAKIMTTPLLVTETVDNELVIKKNDDDLPEINCDGFMAIMENTNP
ncbi:hypothetical protein PQC07_gp119 [Aeromonas phage D3]|uniref:Chemotaxis protein n=1 Tax=Aeromonas phage D3 TaxID=2593327 RepID=A0A514TVX1_9CAUD|nr:hypothetical protein PQC07_gp119 [Aeromonas phage D3]QDJ97154.1 hypothetical protein D3_0156 [Aeromonas phage D3]